MIINEVNQEVNIKRGEVQSDKGDCIDCHLCVDVCPTGIDIRNGIQLNVLTVQLVLMLVMK